MRNRDARQPGKLCLAEHLMLTLTDVLHRRSRQVFMSGINARQQGNVFDRVPSHKARPARRPRLDLPLAHPLPDQARYLRPAQSGYLHQVTPHDSPLPFTQPCVPLRSQYPLHQIVNISLLVRVKTYRPAPFNQFLHLGQTQPFQILHDDLHSPAACLFSPSPFQAHPALDNSAVYGSIFGTVTDATGATVPNARISITDVNKNTKFETVTNAAGNYSRTQLIPGI